MSVAVAFLGAFEPVLFKLVFDTFGASTWGAA